MLTRSQISVALHRFLSKNKHINYTDRFIIDEFKKCQTFLRDHTDVFVTKADKGQITVIMDKNDYVNRMNKLLDEPLTYRKLNKDPINKITSKLNSMVKAWRDTDIIDEHVYRALRCTSVKVYEREPPTLLWAIEDS